MIYDATVYVTATYQFELDAESKEEAEIEAMEIAERKAGMFATSVGIDSVCVMEVEETYASTSAS